ncbi:hypothetical protein D3C79_830180 [compost metagenome]
MSSIRIAWPSARIAESKPFSESSTMKHWPGWQLSARAARRKISGWGLPWPTSSPQTVMSKYLSTLALIRYSSAMARRLEVATAMVRPDLRSRSSTSSKPALIGTP